MSINRRHLGAMILASGATAILGGCAGAAATLEGDVAQTFSDAVTAAEAAAKAAEGAVSQVIASVTTTASAAVSNWQQILGLAEQALLALASTNPLVATIEAAISAGTTILTALPSAVSDATALASTVSQLTSATSAVQTAVTGAATFTAAAAKAA